MSKSCFLSDSQSKPNRELRAALDALGIPFVGIGELRAGSGDLRSALNEAIGRSDLVCISLESVPNETLAYEVGLADGLQKPAIVFAPRGVDLPVVLQGLPVVFTEEPDSETYRLHLEAFMRKLESRSGSTPSRVLKEKPFRQATIWQKRVRGIWQLEPRERARVCEHAVRAVLEHLGAEIREEDRDTGVDFVVWIEELRVAIGNPILVEVASTPTRKALFEKQLRLRGALAQSGASAALLLYATKDSREDQPEIEATLPLFLRLSIVDLLELSRKGAVLGTLISLRNAIAHGGS